MVSELGTAHVVLVAWPKYHVAVAGPCVMKQYGSLGTSAILHNRAHAVFEQGQQTAL